MRKNLQGRRVLLRPLDEGDLARRAAWTRDPGLMRLMVGPDLVRESAQRSHDEEVEENRRWLAGRRKSRVTPYAVEVDGFYIGDIDYDIYPEEKKAELTVFLGDRSAWGKGYGTEAVNLIMKELFQDKTIQFIEVDVVPGNDRAFAFWRKLGFTEHRTDTKGVVWLRRRRDR